MDGRAWWAAVHGVAKSQTRLSDFTFIFHFHALEKEMAPHSRVLAWRNPGTGGAWWAAVYGVAQSRTRLKRFSSSSSSSNSFIRYFHYFKGIWRIKFSSYISSFLFNYLKKVTWASLVAQRLKRLPGMRETRVQSLRREDPLEKEMATHSSTLAWKIPWTEEPGRI